MVATLWLAMAAAAPAAGAHTGENPAPPAQDYRAVLTGSPSLPGVEVRLIEPGSVVEVRAVDDTQVTVLDYAGRPYLRIDKNGVEQNVNSVARMLNQRTDGAVSTSGGVKEGPPRWERVSGSPVAHWHDHRIHWMSIDPPSVRAAPDRRQDVAEWSIPIVVDGTPVELTGVIQWIPRTSLWPYVVAMVAVFGATWFVLHRLRRVARLGVVAVLTGSVVLHVAGLWTARFDPIHQRLGWCSLAIVGLAVTWGGVWLGPPTPPILRRDGAILSAVGSAVVLVWAVLSVTSWSSRSVLPTVWTPAAARVLVAIVIGTAAALLVWSCAQVAAHRAAPGRPTLVSNAG